MTKTESKISRRDQILQCLAHMLEHQPGKRITTAALAKEVGVSEAALYRHFPSKFKMFEGLLEFVEQALFSRVNAIASEAQPTELRLQKIIQLVLAFAEKNPGICRILTGEAIAGENERLGNRVTQIFERLETQLKQMIRQAEFSEGVRSTATVTAAADMLMAYTEGQIVRYVKSDFTGRPTEHWQQQWPVLASGLFSEIPSLG